MGDVVSLVNIWIEPFGYIFCVAVDITKANIGWDVTLASDDDTKGNIGSWM